MSFISTLVTWPSVNVNIQTLESPLCITHSTWQEIDLWAFSKVQLTKLTLSEILGANCAAITCWRALTQAAEPNFNQVGFNYRIENSELATIKLNLNFQMV